MLVILNQSDIDNGVPGDCLRDPVAIALRRITGVPWRVDRQLCFPDTGKHRPFITPKRVLEFIEAFDNGSKVKPFAFELG